MKITVWNYASCAHTALINFSLIAFKLHASGLYFVWVIFAFTAVLLTCLFSVLFVTLVRDSRLLKPWQQVWGVILYNVFVQGDNSFGTVQNSVTREISKVVEWLAANTLSLNNFKTKFMLKKQIGMLKQFLQNKPEELWVTSSSLSW